MVNYAHYRKRLRRVFPWLNEELLAHGLIHDYVWNYFPDSGNAFPIGLDQTGGLFSAEEMVSVVPDSPFKMPETDCFGNIVHRLSRLEDCAVLSQTNCHQILVFGHGGYGPWLIDETVRFKRADTPSWLKVMEVKLEESKAYCREVFRVLRDQHGGQSDPKRFWKFVQEGVRGLQAVRVSVFKRKSIYSRYLWHGMHEANSTSLRSLKTLVGRMNGSVLVSSELCPDIVCEVGVEYACEMVGTVPHLYLLDSWRPSVVLAAIETGNSSRTGPYPAFICPIDR